MVDSVSSGNLDVLKFAAYVVPPTEYYTSVLSFPGTNCMHPYGLTGDFSISFTFYSKGRIIATLDSVQCNQDGRLELDFSPVLSLVDVAEGAIVIADYSHTKTVPVELYFSSTHKVSQSYHAYPALMFMGDALYPTFHDTQLENTQFWPGIAETGQIETCVVIVNPFKISFSFQLSVFCEDVLLGQTKVLKAAPYTAKVLPIQEMFPEQYSQIVASAGRCAVCVSAQYKVVSYVMFRDKRSGIITTIDHMHSYHLV